MRKVFLDDLPRKGTLIDWESSVGFKIPFIYDDINGHIMIIEYVPGHRPRVFVRYRDITLSMSISSLKSCCIGVLLGKITRDFRYKIGDNLKNEDRDITIINREYRKTKNGQSCKYYYYSCNKCGYTGWTPEKSLLKSSFCIGCLGRCVVVGFNDIPTTAPWMIKYFQGGHKEAKKYTKQSNKMIYPICPDCGKVKSKPLSISHINISKSIGCICGDGKSYPEKFMSCLLDQLKVNYDREYSPPWLNGYNGHIYTKRFDFYLPDNKLIIEMDGELGHGKRSFNKITNREESLMIDCWKDCEANKRGLTVIRINSSRSEYDFIKSSIIDSLSKIFNLNDINWSLCEVFATKNMVKKICELYNRIKPCLFTDLSLHSGLGKTTVQRYIRKGERFGWCSYDSKFAAEEKTRRASRGRREKRGKIGIYLPGNPTPIGVYNSVTDISERSLVDLGIILNKTNIYGVMNGDQKTHKGFIFKFIKDLAS